MKKVDRGALSGGALLLAAVGVALPGSAGIYSRGPAPPVAIAPASSGLFVLQGDGQLLEFDTAHQRVIRTVSATNAAYQTVDIASVQRSGTTIPCMSLYYRTRTEANSWVVQFTSAGAKWSWLPERGLYVGMTWLGGTQNLLVVNSSTNSIYQVPFGTGQQGRFFASVRSASRIGLLAHDTATQSLLAVDVGAPSVWSLSLPGKESRKLVTLDQGADLRAAGWSQELRRLYLADSAKETLWLVEVGAAPTRTRRISHARFRDPAGVAITGGSLWVADEGARALFEMTLDGVVRREVAWPPPAAR